MGLRVTDQSRLTNHIAYLQNAADRLDKIQQQMSTGRRIQRASDDPEGASISLGYRREMLFEAQMRRNAESGTAFMNATESALSSATDILQRARELAVQGANGTNSQAGRDAMAIEVDQILQQMVQIGNSSFGGAYIFAGQKSDQPAFITAGGANITAVTYQGDTGGRTRRISKQETVDVNVIGSTTFGDVFQRLIDLRDALRSNSTAVVNQSIGYLDTDLNGILAARADIGSRINRFADTSQRSSAKDTDLQQLKSGIEDIDLSETVVKLTAQQNQLQAALGAIGRTMNMSLLDFLR
jgi:flagellar hook-associated protein 3 FlgL